MTPEYRSARSIALLATLALSVASCEKNQDATPSATGAKAEKTALAKAGTTPAAANEAPPFFAAIPADTPYVFTSLEPLPRSFVNRMFDSFSGLFAQSAQDVQRAIGDDDEPAAKVIGALLTELAKDPTVAGFEELGFSMQPRFALYGLGLLPALRFEVDDASAVKALIERSLAAGSVTPLTGKAGETEYMFFPIEDMSVAVGFVGNEFVAGLAPTAAKDDFFGLLYGATKPAKSLADTGRIQKIASDNGFTGHGVGVIDVKTIVGLFTGDATGSNKDLMAKSQIPLPPLSPQCKAEFDGMTNVMPHVVFGYETMSDTEMRVAAVVGFESSLSAELLGLRKAVAGLDVKVAGRPLATLGLAIDVQKAINFVKAKANSMVTQPYQCELLGDLNGAAREISQGLAAIAVPPEVSQLRGINVVVESAEFAGGAPNDVRATALIASDAPKALLQTAQKLVPALGAVQVTEDGKPRALPPTLIPVPGIEAPHVAINSGGIAISIGAGMQSKLGAVLDAQPGDAQPLFVIAYDLAKIVPIVNQATAGIMAMLPPEEQAELKRSMETQAAVAKFFGLNTYSGTFEKRGLVLRQHVTFK